MPLLLMLWVIIVYHVVVAVAQRGTEVLVWWLLQHVRLKLL